MLRFITTMCHDNSVAIERRVVRADSESVLRSRLAAQGYLVLEVEAC